MDFQAMAARGRRHTELRAQLQRQGLLYAEGCGAPSMQPDDSVLAAA
jgi:hypothetical protein